MFDFGFSELVVIGAVALVVLGPEKLPVVARTAGEWIGKAQRMVAQFVEDAGFPFRVDQAHGQPQRAFQIDGDLSLVHICWSVFCSFETKVVKLSEKWVPDNFFGI